MEIQFATDEEEITTLILRYTQCTRVSLNFEFIFLYINHPQF